MRIKPYVHRCIIQTGDLAGNRYSHEVNVWDYECKTLCDNCHEPLVTTEELMAYIYAELTGVYDG